MVRWYLPTSYLSHLAHQKLARSCKSHPSCIRYAVTSRQSGSASKSLENIIDSTAPKLLCFDPFLWYLARRLSNDSILPFLLLPLLLLLLLLLSPHHLLLPLERACSHPFRTFRLSISSAAILGAALFPGSRVDRPLRVKKKESCLHKRKSWCNIVHNFRPPICLDDAVQKASAAVLWSFHALEPRRDSQRSRLERSSSHMIDITNHEPFPHCERYPCSYNLCLNRHRSILTIVKGDTYRLTDRYPPFSFPMILCHELISDLLVEFYPSSMATSLSGSNFPLTKRGRT